MQEEVTGKTVALIISGTKLSEQVFEKAVKKFLEEVQKSKGLFVDGVASRRISDGDVERIFQVRSLFRADKAVFDRIFHQIEQCPAEQLSGTSGDTELFEKSSNINGFRASEQKTILYIPPFQGDCFEVAALFYAQNKCVN